MATLPDPQALLEFWFGPLTDGLAQESRRQRWFRADDGFDAEVAERFGTLPEAARDGRIDHWLTDPHGRLAYIVATDQLPRNMFRGEASAFAYDGLALTAARDGVEHGHDLQLGWDERAFFYLPFEHSESLVDQHTAVGLYTALRDATPQGLRHVTGEYLRHAHQHRDVVQRFGRFPHRNAALGRTSTDEERAYVGQGGGPGR